MSLYPTFPIYATPTDFWQLVAPPDTLFQDQGIEPGSWTVVTKIGTGTGNMSISNYSNPRDLFSVVVQCLTPGEVTIYGVLNPGPAPTFSISLDGGLSYSPSLSAEHENGTLSFQKGGFTVIFQNGVAPISFVAGDKFLFGTMASPDIIAHLEAASREMDPFLRDSNGLPFLSWDSNVKMICCQLAFWSILRRRGLDKGQDFDIYYPKRAYELLTMIAKGDISVGAVQSGPDFIFPDFNRARWPYRSDWRGF